MSSDRLDKFQWNFLENGAYDDIKSDKKQSFTLSSDSTFLKYILRVTAYFIFFEWMNEWMNETSIFVFAESAIFHSI